MKKTGICRLAGCILVLIFAASRISSAQVSFIETHHSACQATLLTSDNLGNIYTIEGSTLSCRDSLGKVQSTYSNLNSGLFTSVDASDPLKLLLFSREFSSLRFLDQKLTLQGSELDLQKITDGNITLACTSYESGFWLFDASGVQLLRFGSNAELQQSSGNINMAIGEELHPQYIMESANTVYLSDTAKGLFLFDRYGSYLEHMPFMQVLSLQTLGDLIYLMTPETLMIYNRTDHTLKELHLPEPCISGCIRYKTLYLLTGRELKIYNLSFK